MFFQLLSLIFNLSEPRDNPFHLSYGVFVWLCIRYFPPLTLMSASGKNRRFDFIISKFAFISVILGFWNPRGKNVAAPAAPQHHCSLLTSPDQKEEGVRKAEWWLQPDKKHAWNLWNPDNFENHTQGWFRAMWPLVKVWTGR